jgi:ribokinase
MSAPAEPSAPARVGVVGSANADLVSPWRTVRVPARRSSASDLVVLPGGKGANQAVAAARLGARVDLVACVGDDEHGRLLRTSLRSAGVDDALVRSVPVATGTALVLLTADGENSIVVSPGANRQLGQQDVEAAKDLLGQVNVLILQGEVDPEVSAAAAEITHGSGGLGESCAGTVRPGAAAATGDGRSSGGERAGSPRPDPVDRGRTQRRTGRGEDSARAILALGPRSVVVTLGAAGAVAADQHGIVQVSAPTVNVVDTTGAGDALTGALAWRLALGDDLVAALRIAVRVAGLAVTKTGAQPSYPTAAELD